MYSGRGLFDSSFRLSLCWIWTAYTKFQMLCYRKMVVIVRKMGINEFQMLCIRFKAVEIIKLCNVFPGWLNKMQLHLIDLCSNLVPGWACNIQYVLLLQNTSSTISCVRGSNAIDQMSFCCIVVMQYVSGICQCGASPNAFATRRIA